MDELREMRKKAAADADWQRVNDKRAEVFRKLNEAEHSLVKTPESDDADDDDEAAPARDIVAGDKVRLRGLGTLCGRDIYKPGRCSVAPGGDNEDHCA
jgi:hypothetical protein